jgi:flagellar hook-length control protein FliK
MTNLDIAALGVALPLPDTPSAAGTSDGQTDFAALLDEATVAEGESLDPSSVTDEGDADDDEALAALAITSLLSLNAPVESPVEAVDIDIAGPGGIGDADAFLEVTTPDALIDINAQADRGQAGVTAGADLEESAASPVWNSDVRTAVKTDVTAGGATSVSESAVKGESAAPGRETTAETTGSETETRAIVDAHAAPATPSARGSKPSRADQAKATQAAVPNEHMPVVQAVATVADHAAAETAKVDGRKDATDAPTPSSRAARLARALERAAAMRNESGPAALPAADSGGGQPSSSGDGSDERDTQALTAPRHGNRGVTFTIAAPTLFDQRMLARAVDGASHMADTAAPQIRESDVVAQLVQSMRVQFRDGIGEAVVTLKPEHLGSVRVALKVENGALAATVQAEVASVRHWLESQQETLRTSLAEQGLRLERFLVEPDGQRQAARDDAQPREQRRQRQRRRERVAMSATDHPVFEVTV